MPSLVWSRRRPGGPRRRRVPRPGPCWPASTAKGPKVAASGDMDAPAPHRFVARVFEEAENKIHDDGVARRFGFSGALVDRKSTRLNSSHPSISYAVFCLKKKKRIHLSITVHATTSNSPTLPVTRHAVRG